MLTPNRVAMPGVRRLTKAVKAVQSSNWLRRTDRGVGAYVAMWLVGCHPHEVVDDR